MFLSSVLFLASASTFSSAMFVSGTRNFASSFIWYEKLVPENWYRFSGTSFRYRFLVRVSLALVCCMQHILLQAAGAYRMDHSGCSDLLNVGE